MDNLISLRVLIGISDATNNLNGYELFFRVSSKQNFKKIIEQIHIRYNNLITNQHYFSLKYDSNTSFVDLGLNKKDGKNDYNVPDHTVSIYCITDEYKKSIIKN